MDFAVLDRLIKHYSRYALVIATAKRARAIVDDGEDEELFRNNVKPVTVALERLASGEALLSRTDSSYT